MGVILGVGNYNAIGLEVTLGGKIVTVVVLEEIAINARLNNFTLFRRRSAIHHVRIRKTYSYLEEAFLY